MDKKNKRNIIFIIIIILVVSLAIYFFINSNNDNNKNNNSNEDTNQTAPDTNIDNTNKYTFSYGSWQNNKEILGSTSDNLVGFIDIISAKMNLESNVLNIEMNMRELKNTYKVNINENKDNIKEYFWGVNIDANYDETTDGDYIISVSRYKRPDKDESELPLDEYNFQADIWKKEGKSSSSIGIGSFSQEGNTIKISVDLNEVSEELNIKEDMKIFFSSQFVDGANKYTDYLPLVLE